MQEFIGIVTDDERAMYGLEGARVENCRFEGPADGESALKECRDIRVTDCCFSLRYPLWHDERFSLSGCTMTETCRAPLWYCSDGSITGSDIGGVKCLRGCSNIRMDGCRISSTEFGWKCRDIFMTGCSLEGEYPFLDGSGLDIDGLTMDGKYSFQYVSCARIRGSVLRTKDAFWHSRDVTVEDSVIEGEYLGWYSENLTLIRCRISGTQPLCYCRGLTLIDCTMDHADLAFERSDVCADIEGGVDSVKNPLSGCIKADSIGEVILDGAVDSTCEITCPGRQAGHPSAVKTDPVDLMAGHTGLRPRCGLKAGCHVRIISSIVVMLPFVFVRLRSYSFANETVAIVPIILRKTPLGTMRQHSLKNRG